MKALVLLLFCASLHGAVVTYEVPSGRFGDQLLAYMHAKWIAYHYDIPLLFKPFAYSDQLVLDEKETLRTHPSCSIVPIEGDETLAPASDALFMVQFFPESPYDYKFYKWPAFSIDWADPGFRALLRSLIYPKNPALLSELPKDRVTVALHIRHGSGDDSPVHMPHWPLKFPKNSFYLAQLRTLDTLLDHAPLLVHLFTDASDPASLAQQYREALADLDIQFTYHTGDSRYRTHVLDDLFDMMRYDCLIRPESNYSIIAEKLGDYRIVIHPLDYTAEGKIITRIIRSDISP